MSAITGRSTSAGWLMMLPVVALATLIAGREGLGIQADPVEIIEAFFAAILLLFAVVRHPAAFVIPVLFLPRLKEVDALSEFGPLSGCTALELAGTLLATGIVLRWLFAPRLVDSALPRDDFHPDDSPAQIPRLPGKLLLPFLFFAGIVALSYLHTAAPLYGAQKLVAFATLGGAMFLAPSQLFKTERDMWDFIVGAVLFGVLVAFSSLSFSAGGAMGAEDNPAHIGKGQVIALAILLLVYSPIRNGWLRRLVLFVLIPGLAVGLVSAETRGPLFSLLFVLLLGFFLESFRSQVITRKQMAYVGLALVGAVMLLSAFWFYGEEASKFEYKAKEIVSLLEGNGEARGTAVQRLVYYRAALNLWTERPILGWGTGGWSMAYWHQDEREYPHNLFLETLVEQGLIGLAALVFFLGSIFQYLRAHLAQTRPRLPCLLPGFAYLIAIAMFSGDLDDDRFIWFWCGLVSAGCALAVRAREAHADVPSETREAAFTAAPAANSSLSG